MIPKTNSKPQVLLNGLLDEMGISYSNEYNVKYYSVDNYLNEYNLFIEVMGDYWHCNPIKYKTIKYKNQRECIRRDKAKRTYIAEYYGVPVLYLWEADILKQPNLCRAIISAYVSRNGAMENYNSFNYHLEDDELHLNENIVLAYNELSKQELEGKLCLVS